MHQVIHNMYYVSIVKQNNKKKFTYKSHHLIVVPYLSHILTIHSPWRRLDIDYVAVDWPVCSRVLTFFLCFFCC